MVTFKGYEELIDTIFRFKQDHVFQYWEELDHKAREDLLVELSNVDFDLINELYHSRDKGSSNKLDFEPAPYIPLPHTTEELAGHSRAREIGIEYIREGKIAALLVAGGQGSRLDFDGPKGITKTKPVDIYVEPVS